MLRASHAEFSAPKGRARALAKHTRRIYISPRALLPPLCAREYPRPVNSATFERVPAKRADISRKLPLWSRQYAKRAAVSISLFRRRARTRIADEGYTRRTKSPRAAAILLSPFFFFCTWQAGKGLF